MSGVAENILCGIVVEVLRTCFVYGNKWIQNYRHADDYKEEDGEAMKEVVNKLMDIKDFYVEFWPHIPNRDRILLGKCLKRIHAILCDSSTQNNFSIVIGTETILALSPMDIYQRLGQYNAAVQSLEVTSIDASTFSGGVWERMKKEVARVTDKLAYSIVGKDRHRKLIRTVGEWIDKIDDLIGFRSNQLILRGIIGSGPLTQMVQRTNLPNTSNRIGLLLTNTTPPPNVEHDVTLNPEVTTFNRNSITMIDNSRIDEGSPELGGNRNWATFSPQPTITTDSPERKVILEFKPISQSNAPFYSSDAIARALREVRSLVQALHIASREPDKLHVLDCLGLFELPHSVGIIFKLPFEDPNQFKCQTLNSILLNDRQENMLSRDLNNRFALATALAWSLSRFHMANWVHKSFTSDNILLFQNMATISGREGGYSWDSPFLVGFELSRPSLAYSDPMAYQPVEWKYRAYIHPDRLGNDGSAQSFVRFTKRHDIYSLGVVLLELGLLCPFTASRFHENPNPSKNLSTRSPAELWHKFQKMAKELSRNMGSIYADVTNRCLSGDFGIGEDDRDDLLLIERFTVLVCERLQSIQV